MNWKPISKFPNYLISDCGKVKRIEHYLEKSNGSRVRYPEKMMNPTLDSHGYYFLRLGRNRKGCWVHRMVAEEFIGFTEDRKYVNHKDGNPKNNHVSNLEICTSGENQKHAYATGLKEIPSGSKNGNYKGTIVATCMETGMQVEFNSRKELEEFGFPAASVYACCLGKQKQSCGYTFKRKANE